MGFESGDIINIKHADLRGFFQHPKNGGHWIKSTNVREGSWYRNYDAASGPILKKSEGFHKSMQYLYIYYAPERPFMHLTV